MDGFSKLSVISQVIEAPSHNFSYDRVYKTSTQSVLVYNKQAEAHYLLRATILVMLRYCCIVNSAHRTKSSFAPRTLFKHQDNYQVLTQTAPRRERSIPQVVRGAKRKLTISTFQTCKAFVSFPQFQPKPPISKYLE